MSKLLLIGFALTFATSLMMVGCQPPPSANSNVAGQTHSAEWDKFVTSFLDSYFAARPDVGILAGRHEFDGRLPDWTSDGLTKEIARLKAQRTLATKFQDSDLGSGQQFERNYLIAQVDKDLFWLETADAPHRNPFFYADAIDPDVYVSRKYAPLPDRLKAYTAYARSVPVAVEQIRSNLKLPLPRTYIDIGRTTLSGLASFYEKDVPNVFASVTDTQLQQDFQTANAGAIKAMKDLDTWFASQIPTATDNFALGPEKFAQMLKATEGVDIPLDQLEKIGRNDLDRNLAALKDACEKFAPGKSVAECVTAAEADKPTGDVIAAAREQLGDLRKFIVDKGVVSIPGTEEAQVAQAPPYKAWNFAYINIPGPYENGLPSIYYIAPPDPSWPKEKQESYLPGKGTLLFTSAHEVWPGHFLQFLHANRSSSKFGQVFVGYAFAEGWAHYAEEMMWDMGLGDQSVEMHIGQLKEALLRNVRFLSAIGMHTHGMTVAESEKMFREQGLQDAGNSDQQARRGTFDPAYLNYTMGKLMIRKLREDWTASRGGRTAWKDFHDEFLKYGGPPIPLVRKAMMGGDSGSLF